jgi:Mrp family chromosome partitioning ATPase
VILLEGDLRQPVLARRLALEAPIDIARLLSSLDTADSPLVEVALPDEATGNLFVLACGTPPSNPAELSSSPEMRDLIDDLVALADIVVIDSSPLLAVPDALSLLPAVESVVLVARLNHTRRDHLARSLRVLREANARTFGVVVTGAQRDDPYYASRYEQPVAARGSRA